MGLAGFRSRALVALGGAHLLAGSPAEAMAALEDAQRTAAPDALSTRASASRCSPALPTLTSRWATWNGRSPSPLREAAASGSTKRLGAADAFLARSRTLRATGPAKYAAEIVRLLDSAEAVARHCAARIYEPLILEERARLARACGEEDESLVGTFAKRYGSIGRWARTATAGASTRRSATTQAQHAWRRPRFPLDGHRDQLLNLRCPRGSEPRGHAPRHTCHSPLACQRPARR